MATSWSSKETTNDSFPDVYFGFLKISESGHYRKKPNQSKTWLWNFPRKRRASRREYRYHASLIPRKKNPSVTTLEHHDKSPAILVVCNQQKSSKALPIWGICKLVSSLFVAEGVVVVFITKNAIGWVRRN